MGIAYLLVDLAFGEDKKIVNKLKKLNFVENAYRLIGEWDALVKLRDKNIDEAIKKVQNIDGVGQNIVLVVTDEVT